MKICIVEKNFVSFLTAIYQYYHEINDIDEISSDLNMCTLLDDIINVYANKAQARIVRSDIIKQTGRNGYKDISNAYLSNDKSKEQKIFRYIKLVFLYGNKVHTMYYHQDVIAFNDMLKKVKHEVHRLSAFIRFQEMDNGVFYAFFGSDNDILELLLPHFKTRFNIQKFVIHDIVRGKMAYFDGEKCNYIVAPESVNITLSDEETMFTRLWKKYFVNVAISERKNPRLQNHYVPKKYRYFMNEF